VSFVGSTSVVAPGAGATANIVSVSPFTVVAPSQPTPVSCSALPATSITCTLNFASGFTGAGSTISFDVTVQSPDVGTNSSVGTLTFASTTSWSDPENDGESSPPLQTPTTLIVPNPKVVDTYLPAPGTVKTGTTGGAATCDQPWVTIVKVPAAAQVGVDLRSFTDPTLPPGTQFFSTIGIPNLADPLLAPKLFGVGTHWYDPGAASILVVNTLRRDVCTVPGSNPIQKAAHILKEKIYYQPEGGQFQQVLLCIVTSGPTPGNPCIAFAQVYTQWTLPRNVTSPSDYLGDHEWVIFANENGKYGAP